MISLVHAHKQSSVAGVTPKTIILAKIYEMFTNEEKKKAKLLHPQC